MKRLIIFLLLLVTVSSYGQWSIKVPRPDSDVHSFKFYLPWAFPNTDSLRNYNTRWIDNNAAKAFTNLRLHYLLDGIIDFLDVALQGSGAGGQYGIDSLAKLNDTTIRYRKNGVFHNLIFKGQTQTLQQVLDNGPDLTANESISLLDSLSIVSGKLILDSLRIRNAPQVTDTVGLQIAALDEFGQVKRLMLYWGDLLNSLSNIGYGLVLNDGVLEVDTSEVATPFDLSQLQGINGVTRSGNDFKLGGDLSENTTINLSGNNFTISGTDGTNSGSWTLSTSSNGQLKMDAFNPLSTSLPVGYRGRWDIANKPKTSSTYSVTSTTRAQAFTATIRGGFWNDVSATFNMPTAIADAPSIMSLALETDHGANQTVTGELIGLKSNVQFSDPSHPGTANFNAYTDIVVGSSELSSVTSNLTTRRGLVVLPIKNARINKPYGIVQLGTTDTNYYAGVTQHMGNFGIGIANPTSKLHVVGSPSGFNSLVTMLSTGNETGAALNAVKVGTQGAGASIGADGGAVALQLSSGTIPGDGAGPVLRTFGTTESDVVTIHNNTGETDMFLELSKMGMWYRRATTVAGSLGTDLVCTLGRGVLNGELPGVGFKGILQLDLDAVGVLGLPVSNEDCAQISWRWTDPNWDSFASALDFKVANNAAMYTTLTLENTGQLTATQYGQGNITGTPAYNLSVTSTGGIIEAPVTINSNVSDSATSVSSVDVPLTDFAGYDRVEIQFEMQPATDNRVLFMRVSPDGSNFDAGATDYEWGNTVNITGNGTGSQSITSNNTGGAAEIRLSSGLGNASDETCRGRITIYEPNQATFRPTYTGEIIGNSTSGLVIRNSVFGQRQTAQQTQAVRFYLDSGNFARFKYRVIGYRN